MQPQKKAIVTPRRRVRPKKETSEDDAGSDTSNVEIENVRIHNKDEQKCHFHNKTKRISKDCSTTTTTTTDSANENFLNKNNLLKNEQTTLPQKIINDNQNLYESLQNLKFCPPNIKNSCHKSPIDNNIVNNLQIKEEEDTCRDCSLEVAAHKHNLRKKLLRKSRAKKQAKEQIEEPVSRVRSLSVGNENCYNETENNEECWKSSIRRHELIEIIRESMEKNRLCFQTNRYDNLFFSLNLKKY